MFYKRKEKYENQPMKNKWRYTKSNVHKLSSSKFFNIPISLGIFEILFLSEYKDKKYEDSNQTYKEPFEQWYVEKRIRILNQINLHKSSRLKFPSIPISLGISEILLSSTSTSKH